MWVRILPLHLNFSLRLHSLDFTWFWRGLDSLLTYIDKKLSGSREPNFSLSLSKPIFVIYVGYKQHPEEISEKLKELSRSADFFVMSSDCDYTYVELLNPRIVVDEVGFMDEIQKKIDLMIRLTLDRTEEQDPTKVQG